MALDMSDGGQGGWFGFSPAVVVVLALAVLAGGGVFWKARGDVYVDAVAKVCAESEQELVRRTDSPLVYDPARGSFFQLASALSQDRIDRLARVAVPADRKAFHDEAVALERAVIVSATEGQAYYERQGSRGITPLFNATRAAQLADDAHYASLGLKSGCAD